MPGQHPRNFEEYLRKLERDIARANRAPITIANGVIEVVHMEQEARDQRRPTAPIELTYQTAAYISGSDKRPYVRLIVDFPDVTKATDGTDIAISHYELWGRDVSPGVLDITTSAVPGLAAPGLTVPGMAATYEQKQADLANKTTNNKFRLLATSAESSFRAEQLPVGALYEVLVRAIGVNTVRPGNESTRITIQLLDDSTEPPQATAPVVTAERGQIRVTHDGQAVTGAMPADLSYFILAAGDDAQPTTEVTRFGRAGLNYIHPGAEYYKPKFFRVRAVDESDNEGPWSAVAFTVAEPLVDEDIILSELDAAKTHLKNVDAGVSILPNTVIAEHLVATESLSSKVGQFLHLKAGQIDVNDLWADSAFFGIADALLVRSDMFMGKSFEGGQFTLTHGGKFQTNPEDLKGVKVTSTGIQAWNPSTGELTVEISAATGRMLATGTFYTDLTGSRVRIGDRDNISAIDLWSDTTIAHGAFFHFLNLDGVYGTQMTQFGTDSETIPKTYLQLRDNGWTLARGQYRESTQYAEIDDDRGEFVHEAGNLQLADTDTQLARTRGTRWPYLNLNSSYVRLAQGYNRTSGDQNDYSYLNLEANRVFLRNNASYSLDIASNYIQFTMGGGNNWLLQSNALAMNTHGGVHGLNIFTNGSWRLGPNADVAGLGRGRIDGTNDALHLYGNGTALGGANWFLLNGWSFSQLTGGLNLFGGLNVYNGTKNFVMPHPTKPGMELAHAATESPWSGIHYWDNGTLNEDGYWIVQLPDYFEAIAAQDHRQVIVTSPSGAKLKWDHVIVNGEFMVEGPAGAPFGWEVKARREGYDVEVERWVDGLRNAGEPEPDADVLASRRRGQVPQETAYVDVPEPKMKEPQLLPKPKDRNPFNGSRSAGSNSDTRRTPRV